MENASAIATRASEQPLSPDTRLTTLASVLFPKNCVPLPSLAEAYELQLAYLEAQSLSPAELLARGAYFMRVGDKFTHHFRLCSGAPVRLGPDSSEKLRSFFERNLYRTGYASHGLFPYRGKFHPQMIRALINVMGLQSGDILLDPMMGSGTALIEASIMGIRSVGLDASPFCVMMTNAKAAALTIQRSDFRNGAAQLLKWVQARSDLSKGKTPAENHDALREAVETGSPGVACVLELAFLDAVGYWRRRSGCPFDILLAEVLERYTGVIGKFEAAASSLGLTPADISAQVGDARKLPFEGASVDGVLFSPPYSFAIDYVENDEPQLRYLGADIARLREQMIGIRGRYMKDRVSLYLRDMDLVMSEVARVLRPGKFATLIVGSNTRQLAAALRIPEDQVQGLEEHLIALGERHGLRLQMLLERPIHGISNSMRLESIILLQKKT